MKMLINNDENRSQVNLDRFGYLEKMEPVPLATRGWSLGTMIRHMVQLKSLCMKKEPPE